MTRMVIVTQISSDPSLFDPHFAAVAAAQKPPSSSSMLMGRQTFPMGPGPAVDVLPPGSVGSKKNPSDSNPSHSSTSTSDCQPQSKGDHKGDSQPQTSSLSSTEIFGTPAGSQSKGDHKASNQQSSSPTYMDLVGTPAGPPPAIARRGPRPTWGSEGSPDIFDRDGSPTRSRRSNPITVGDIFARYLRRALAGQKRAAKPRTSRDFN